MKPANDRPGTEPHWRIGVDVGGTFTDVVAVDGAGTLYVRKVASDPGDPAAAVLAGLAAVARDAGCSVRTMLSQCALFVHGTTTATNTLLERKGAKVGLIATEGFRDSIEIRRGWRHDVWSHRLPNPPVLALRRNRRPVRGRIDADGTEHALLNTGDIDDAINRLRAEGVESVAVCLFNSYRNDSHERFCAEMLRRHWENVSVSSEIAPVIGEYERSSTAVVDAYVAPRTLAYLTRLRDTLGALGMQRPLLVTQNNGGVMPLDNMRSVGAPLLLSGPAAGVGALTQIREAVGSGDLISMEIGGTSCDAVLMKAGRVAVSEELEIGGYPVVVPSVDIHTVGAGGGTIARVDAGGMLQVGPDGAGAAPGPACYGLGGTLPTITDAQLVLGRLAPAGMAAGGKALDAAAAKAAIAAHVAHPLGIAVDAAAAGIVRLLEQHLLHALQRISVERGEDPREFVLVACGGAGPMHGASVARLLGCRRVYVPRLSGAFCALGMLYADVRRDLVRAYFAPIDDESTEPLRIAVAEQALKAREAVVACGFGAADVVTESALDLRYSGQNWTVRVPLAPGPIQPQSVRETFETVYARLYGHIQPGGAIETTAIHVVGRGRMQQPRSDTPSAAAGEVRPYAERSVHFGNWQQVPIYAGASLAPGHAVPGPAIVEEATTTVVVPPGERLYVDEVGNFMIEIFSTSASP